MEPNLNSEPSADKDLDSSIDDSSRTVKHIMVIGFHHKHGYQVDYCYPPLNPGDSAFSTPDKPICLPSCWKTLPLLCLPDGSHNYSSDTIYFTMPDQVQAVKHNSSNMSSEIINQEKSDNHQKGIRTIFGTACYRQIQADKLLNRTDDITRVAVQKSVCVLSTKPLFGIIRSKLEMITHAYFEELDFSKVKILKLTFDNLNSLLSRESVVENATFLGLSARQLLAQFGCNTLTLFKAMLLEKKILFYKSPVRDLCSTIISMCSIFPGLLEEGGLNYSTCDLQLSSHLLEALKLARPNELSSSNTQEPEETLRNDKVYFSPSREEVVIVKENASIDDKTSLSLDEFTGLQVETNEFHLKHKACEISETMDDDTKEYVFVPTDVTDQQTDDSNLEDAICVEDPYLRRLCRLKPKECGLPLQIFTNNSFCLPYLSISYLDLLADSRVKSFVIGATNFLFKQRKEMYDVIVDMEENSITINDSNLKKCLSLSTEDLRFMDYLCKHVKLESEQSEDMFDLSSHEITNWIGGDEWIRFQFRVYTMYLLKASRGNSIQMEPFNASFVQLWRQTTNNYQTWVESGKTAVLDKLQSRHPFSANSKGLNLSDMRLKLNYAVQSSERGRIINQTLNDIGKWSIWNNIATAAAAAGSSASSTLSAALLAQDQKDQDSACNNLQGSNSSIRGHTENR